MGHIKEPIGVDLVVGPSKLTEEDLKVISEIIAKFKKTGKTPKSKSTDQAKKKHFA